MQYYKTPIQVIIHACKNGIFPKPKSDCTRIPKILSDGMLVVHLGLVFSHYFLTKSTKDLDKLSYEDFEKFSSNNDRLLSKLNTKNPIATHDMIQVGGRYIEYEESSSDEVKSQDKSVIINDAMIDDLIRSYNDQDRKAGRVCDLTIQQEALPEGKIK